MFFSADTLDITFELSNCEYYLLCTWQMQAGTSTIASAVAQDAARLAEEGADSDCWAQHEAAVACRKCYSYSKIKTTIYTTKQQKTIALMGEDFCSTCNFLASGMPAP